MLVKTLVAIAVAATLFIALSAKIYIEAPVEKLRGSIPCAAPGGGVRQCGLAVPGNLALEDMPLNLILTMLVAEDPQFPHHRGLAPDNILRGDTITQQLAETVFTGPAHDAWRRYAVLLTAIKIEQYYSKAEIFSLYASTVPTGPHSYGFATAAHDAFGKSVSRLTDAEGAYVVSLAATWRDPALTDSAPARMTQSLQYMLILRNRLFGQNPPPVDAFFFQRYFKGVTIAAFDSHSPSEAFRAQAQKEMQDFTGKPHPSFGKPVAMKTGPGLLLMPPSMSGAVPKQAGN